MVWINEIINFLEDYSAVHSEDPDIDIYADMRMVGDDFREMIEAYAEVYGIDMSNYLWYFHTDEEGLNLGGLFFKPPYLRVERIPITPRILAKFIETKRWKIDYPEHSLPKKRYDLIINTALLILSIVCLFVSIFFKLIT